MAGSDVESIMERIDAAIVAVSERIEAAVAQGRLTPEEGEEKLRQARGDVIWKAALSIDPDQWPSRCRRSYWNCVPARPSSSLHSGRETRGKRMRKANVRNASGPPPWHRSQRVVGPAQSSHTRTQTQEYAKEIAGAFVADSGMQLSERLRTAVEAGEISPEEAKQKLEEARSKMGRDANNKGGERRAAGRKTARLSKPVRSTRKKQSRSSKKRAVKWTATRTTRVASA